MEELAQQSKINYTVVEDSPYFEYFKNMAGAEEDLYKYVIQSNAINPNNYKINSTRHLYTIDIVRLVLLLLQCLEKDDFKQ